MCGRYFLDPEEDIEEIRALLREWQRELYGHDASSPIKTGEICPTDLAPVIAGQNGRLVGKAMRWGFPRWNGGGVVINARAETAQQKSMFQPSLTHRRCVIPTTGFFEWKRSQGSKTKEKFLFTDADTPVLYLAGIYQVFEETDTNTPRFCILTTAANASMAQYHDRMPILLKATEKEAWILDPQFFQSALTREPAALQARPIENGRAEQAVQTTLF